VHFCGVQGDVVTFIHCIDHFYIVIEMERLFIILDIYHFFVMRPFKILSSSSLIMQYNIVKYDQPLCNRIPELIPPI
jgi:hypothetical protein